MLQADVVFNAGVWCLYVLFQFGATPLDKTHALGCVEIASIGRASFYRLIMHNLNLTTLFSLVLCYYYF